LGQLSLADGSVDPNHEPSFNQVLPELGSCLRPSLFGMLHLTSQLLEPLPVDRAILAASGTCLPHSAIPVFVGYQATLRMIVHRERARAEAHFNRMNPFSSF
jgi:hypothetical protein